MIDIWFILTFADTGPIWRVTRWLVIGYLVVSLLLGLIPLHSWWTIRRKQWAAKSR
jgi:hypothetical protein